MTHVLFTTAVIFCILSIHSVYTSWCEINLTVHDLPLSQIESDIHCAAFREQNLKSSCATLRGQVKKRFASKTSLVKISKCESLYFAIFSAKMHSRGGDLGWAYVAEFRSKADHTNPPKPFKPVNWAIVHKFRHVWPGTVSTSLYLPQQPRSPPFLWVCAFLFSALKTMLDLYPSPPPLMPTRDGIYEWCLGIVYNSSTCYVIVLWRT